MDKPHAPSCERNREPILAVLRDRLADRHSVLEIGSGTGEHAVHFAAAMPWLSWQTSERAENLAGIQAWLDDTALANTPAPLALDVGRAWPSGRWDAVFSANTLHIMSWAEVEQLFAHLAEVTTDDALLIVYGPFNYDGHYSSDSNAGFDQWLKARGSHMGIRDAEAVDALARQTGFVLIDDVAMPANNRCRVWQRRAIVSLPPSCPDNALSSHNDAGLCPCGTERDYADCCKPLHDGEMVGRDRRATHAVTLQRLCASAGQVSARDLARRHAPGIAATRCATGTAELAGVGGACVMRSQTSITPRWSSSRAFESAAGARNACTKAAASCASTGAGITSTAISGTDLRTPREGLVSPPREKTSTGPPRRNRTMLRNRLLWRHAISRRSTVHQGWQKRPPDAARRVRRCRGSGASFHRRARSTSPSPWRRGRRLQANRARAASE